MVNLTNGEKSVIIFLKYYTENGISKLCFLHTEAVYVLNVFLLTASYIFGYSRIYEYMIIVFRKLSEQICAVSINDVIEMLVDVSFRLNI